jgi:hypothetical protein
VDQTQIVELIITVPYVSAKTDILVIHLQDVIPFHVRIFTILSFNSFPNKFILNIAKIPQQDEYRDPCNPSPCGPYSQCRDINGSPSCSCLPSYNGAPPNCRPECIINSECPSNKACINEKCKDPCPGSCGIGANCNVINHTPVCTCPDRYTGDPFTNCYPAPPRKMSFDDFLTFAF